MPFKMGRKAPVFTRRSVRSALCLAEAMAPLGTPPEVSTDWATPVEKYWGGWQMFANDRVGCCTMADSAHLIMVHTANAGYPFVPSEDDVLDAYSACTGYNPSAPLVNGENPTDQGANEVDVCEFMRKVGLAGHKSSAHGSVDPSRLDHIKWVVQLFGGCRTGIVVTKGMSDQFDQGRPWDGSGDQTILGGHDVPIITYDKDFLWVATWGKLQAMTPQCFSKICDEAHAEIFEDWIRETGTAPSGLNVSQLVQYLNQL